MSRSTALHCRVAPPAFRAVARAQCVPMLVRVFICDEKNFEPGMFQNLSTFPTEMEVGVYVWSDVTLLELIQALLCGCATEQIVPVVAQSDSSASTAGITALRRAVEEAGGEAADCEIVVSHIYPGADSRPAIREIASIALNRPPNRKSYITFNELMQSSFSFRAGDILSLRVVPVVQKKLAPEQQQSKPK